jgi:hypothetical protein
VREEQGNRVYFDFFEEVCVYCIVVSEVVVAWHYVALYLTVYIFNRHLTIFQIKDMLV